MPTAKKEKVLISVIVTVYNTADYLLKCLGSLGAQTFKEIEIICIDDGSTDNSLDILKKFHDFDNRFKVINQKHQGVSVARNVGLKEASGKYIAFVDSDDFVSPTMLSILYKTISKYKTDAVIFNYYDCWDNNYSDVHQNFSDFLISNEEEFLEYLLMDEKIHNYLCFRLYKRELFSGFEFPKDKVFEDIYLSIHLIGKMKSIYYLDEPLYFYYHRRDSITNDLSISNIQDAIDSYYTRYLRIKEEYPKLMDVNVYSILKWFSYMIDNYGNRKEFFKKYKKIIKVIIDDLKEVDIKRFSDNKKYSDVLKFIEDYDDYYNKRVEEFILISVIVPVYNMEEYLVKCLENLCSQTLKEIEIICVDDGSTDNSSNILREFQNKDKRIKIITQTNQGLSAARNAGLDIAVGKYIAFVDSDDFVSPNMFKKLYDVISKYNTDIVVCNHFVMGEDYVYPKSQRADFMMNSEKKYLSELLLDESIFNYVWSRLYKREIFEDVRFRKGKVFEDIYLSNDLIGKINNAFYISDPLYCYRMRNGSITNSLDFSSIKNSIEAIILRYNSINKKYPDLQVLNIFSTLRWISIMAKDYGENKIDNFFEVFNKEINYLINDLNQVDISIFSNRYKYDYVLELVTNFNLWLKNNNK